jgi:hypothetical protein
MVKVMAKQIMAIGVVMVMLLTGNLAWSEDCGIVNPSFEDDGAIDLAVDDPNGWTVDLMGGGFGGYIYTNWHVGDGHYSLSLHSIRRVRYYPGDVAKVSMAEPISLTGIRQINFNLKLDSNYSSQWNPDTYTAIVMVDEDVVWDSNIAGLNALGEYLNQAYVVEGKYKDDDLHTLSLGMRMNAEKYDYLDEIYIVRWDVIDCNLYCGGAAPLEGDINQDCCVDGSDLKLLAEVWLGEAIELNDPANLYHDDDLTNFATIDFRDFAVYAGEWDGTLYGLAGLAEYWLAIVDPDYEYNLFTEDDIRPRGEINFMDLAVLGNNWLECSVIE